MRNGQEQQKQLSNDVKLAEDTLAGHMDEINAIHDHLLGKLSSCWKYLLACSCRELLLTCDFSSSTALANLGDAEGSSSRLEHILKVGEIISATAAAAKMFAAKFFPSNSDPVDLDQTASMLTRAAEERDNVLRSAALGGVKVALAML